MTSEAARRLRATLEQLTSELDQLDSLDDDSLREISGLVAALRERLAKPVDESPSDDDGSVADRLEELEQGFQTRHPAVAGLLLRVVEALRQLGI